MKPAQLVVMHDYSTQAGGGIFLMSLVFSVVSYQSWITSPFHSFHVTLKKPGRIIQASVLVKNPKNKLGSKTSPGSVRSHINLWCNLIHDLYWKWENVLWGNPQEFKTNSSKTTLLRICCPSAHVHSGPAYLHAQFWTAPGPVDGRGQPSL